MPPRFSYWTIIAGGLPTAFRAADREELLPTFTRLKEKQPDAEMKWFARGRLWTSPEDARAARERSRGETGGRQDRSDRQRSDSRGRDAEERPREERPREERRGREKRGQEKPEVRGREWRPGGTHRDPRQPFKDAKKERNQRLKAGKFARKFGSDRKAPPREHRDEPAREAWTRERRPEQPRKAWTSERRPEQPRKAWTSERRPEQPRKAWTSERRPEQPRKAWTSERRPEQPRKSWGSQNRGDRRSDTRPGGSSHKPWKDGVDRPRVESRAPREKPHGDALTRPPRAPHGQDRPRRDDRGGERRSTPGSGRQERSTYRGEGHGDNGWKGGTRREDADRGPRRPFSGGGFSRDRVRGQGTEEPPSPPRPRGPNREPRPSEQPPPSAPPRPTEPVVPPPGPPERGRLNRQKRNR